MHSDSRFIIAATEECVPYRVVRKCSHQVLVAFQNSQALASVRIPNSNGSVIGPRNECRAIVSEHGMEDEKRFEISNTSFWKTDSAIR